MYKAANEYPYRLRCRKARIAENICPIDFPQRSIDGLLERTIPNTQHTNRAYMWKEHISLWVDNDFCIEIECSPQADL